MLAVFAIAVRHGMMLIHHAMHLEAHNGNVVSPSLVHRAAQDRLAPIVMTTLATALALTPFAVRSPVPGLEILHPMAVIILGGLITSTLVNLFIVPSLYLHFAPSASVKPIDQPHSLGVPAFGSPAD